MWNYAIGAEGDYGISYLDFALSIYTPLLGPHLIRAFLSTLPWWMKTELAFKMKSQQLEKVEIYTPEMMGVLCNNWE